MMAYLHPGRPEGRHHPHRPAREEGPPGGPEPRGPDQRPGPPLAYPDHRRQGRDRQQQDRRLGFLASDHRRCGANPRRVPHHALPATRTSLNAAGEAWERQGQGARATPAAVTGLPWPPPCPCRDSRPCRSGRMLVLVEVPPRRSRRLVVCRGGRWRPGTHRVSGGVARARTNWSGPAQRDAVLQPRPTPEAASPAS